MSETYQAILRANHLEWCGDTPSNLSADTPVRVQVTLLEKNDLPHAAQGQRMAQILEQLASNRAVVSIDDAEAWQREIRRDRPLPGRQE